MEGDGRMTTIGLTATDQSLTVAVNPKITSGDVNTVDVQVEFSEDWNGYAKSAVFFTSINPNAIYEIVMTNNRCIVPAEVLEKSCILSIGVRGVNSNDNAIKTTSLVKYKITEGTPAGTVSEIEPTPDVYQQLLTAYGKIDDAICDLNKLSTYVTPEMFGAKGDGVTDDTDAFNEMVATEIPIKLTPNKVYKIDGIVSADIFFIGLDGNHSIIEGGRFELNVNNGTWTKPYSQPYSYIRNVRFYNSANTENLTCIKSGLPIDFERVVFNKYTVSFEKIGTYLDHVSMKNVLVYNPIGDDYRIKLSGLGDDSIFESCQFDGDKSFYGLSLNGVLFINCLQGNYFINNSKVKFLNCHIEGGHGVTIMDRYSDVNFDSCTFWNTSILPTDATYENCKMMCNNQTNTLENAVDAKIMVGNNVVMCSTEGVYPEALSENKMFDLRNCPDTSHYSSVKCINKSGVTTKQYNSWKKPTGTYNYTFYPSIVPFGLDGGNMPVAKSEYSLEITSLNQMATFVVESYIFGGYIHAYRTNGNVVEKAVIPISKGYIIDFGNNINGYKWEVTDSVPNPSASGAIFYNGSYFKSTAKPNSIGYLWINTTNNTVSMS